MQTRIDMICERVMRKDCDLTQLEKDLMLISIPANGAHSKYGISIFDCAARSGSLAVNEYLFKSNFSAQAGLYAFNLFEWSSENTKDVRDFFLSEEHKIWNHFEDKTTDLHADAMAGRIISLKQKIQENPDRVNEINYRFHTPLFYAGLGQQAEVATALQAAGALDLPANPNSKDFHILAVNYLGLAYLARKTKNNETALTYFKQARNTILKAQDHTELERSFNNVDDSVLLMTKACIEEDLASLYVYLNNQNLNENYLKQAQELYNAALKTLANLPSSAQNQRYFRKIELIHFELDKLFLEKKSIEHEQKGDQQEILDLLCEIAFEKSTSQESLANFIKENNININMRHSEHKTRPIEFAAQNGSLDNVKYLLELKADVDASQSPFNLIEWADKNDEVREYLCSQKIWQRFNDGTTELHIDAAAGRLTALQNKLKNNPEKLHVLTDKGKSLMDYAKLKGSNPVVKFLEWSMRNETFNKAKALAAQHQWFQAAKIYFDETMNSDLRKKDSNAVSKVETHAVMENFKMCIKYLEQSCRDEASLFINERRRLLIASHAALSELYTSNAQFEKNRHRYHAAGAELKCSAKHLNHIINFLESSSPTKTAEDFEVLTGALLNRINNLLERIKVCRMDIMAPADAEKKLFATLEEYLNNFDLTSLPFALQSQIKDIRQGNPNNNGRSIHEEKNNTDDDFNEDKALAEAIRLSLEIASDYKEEEPFEAKNINTVTQPTSVNLNVSQSLNISPTHNIEEKEEKHFNETYPAELVEVANHPNTLFTRKTSANDEALEEKTINSLSNNLL